MSKAIQYGEIRVGDVIKIVDTREVKIERVDQDMVMTTDGEYVRPDSVSGDRFSRTLKLVERKLIPADVKHVVIYDEAGPATQSSLSWHAERIDGDQWLYEGSDGYDESDVEERIRINVEGGGRFVFLAEVSA